MHLGRVGEDRPLAVAVLACLPVTWLCAAASGSRRTLVATGYTAAGLDTGTASGTLEIGRIDLHFVAACHGTVPLGANLPSASSQRLASTDALLCRFSAAVSLQVLRWLSGLFQKLRIRVAEGMTKSGECLREEIPRAGVRRRFKHAVSHLASWAL